MAELIERLLAALIVIILLGIVLYLMLNNRVVVQSDRTTPAAETVEYAKKNDRLEEAKPSELKKDWSRSPTLVVVKEPEVRVVREKPRRVVHEQREYVSSGYWRDYDYEERRPARRERAVHTYRYHDDDCFGADCACACERPPYWSSSGWVCPD